MQIKGLFSIVLFFSLLHLSNAQDTIHILLSPASPGKQIAPDFAGLSFEMNSVNKAYFAPHKDTLIRFFQTLGLQSLRIGGNSVDKDTLSASASSTRFTKAGLDSLFGFAKQAGCKVLLGLNFGGDFNPALASGEVSYVQGKYATSMKGWEIGNEADLYHSNGLRPTTYTLANFEAQYLQYRDTILAHSPLAILTGPTAATNYSTFTLPFCRAMKGKFSLLTQHYYVGAANAAPVRKQVVALMSAAKMNAIVSEVKALVQGADSVGVPFRMGECNSFYNGGQWSVSDAFASALWALDYMYALANAGCAGVNFHGALGGPYTVIAYQNKKYSARPIYYGILAFQAGSKGKFVAQTVTNNHINLNSYAVIDTAGILYTTVVNKDTLQNAVIDLDAGSGLYTTASVLTLTAPSFTDTLHTTLGGQAVTSNGTLSAYSWQSLPVANHLVQVSVPFGSAAIIRFAASATGIPVIRQESGFGVYPNPTGGTCYLESEREIPEGTLLELYDASGKKRGTLHLLEKRTLISLSDVPSGIYLLRVFSKPGLLFETKVIKQ